MVSVLESWLSLSQAVTLRKAGLVLCLSSNVELALVANGFWWASPEVLRAGELQTDQLRHLSGPDPGL